MFIISKGLKALIVSFIALFFIIAIIVVFFVSLVHVFLILLPLIILVIVAGYFFRMLNKLKKEKHPNSINVKYRVKKE